MDWTALHFFDFNLERVLHCSFSISHIFSRNGCPLIIFSHNSSCTVLQPFFTPLYNLLQTSSSSIKRIEGYCFGSHSVNQYRNSSILLDRKSTRLNSSHVSISYAVFCLKKKNVIHMI